MPNYGSKSFNKLLSVVNEELENIPEADKSFVCKALGFSGVDYKIEFNDMGETSVLANEPILHTCTPTSMFGPEDSYVGDFLSYFYFNTFNVFGKFLLADVKPENYKNWVYDWRKLYKSVSGLIFHYKRNLRKIGYVNNYVNNLKVVHTPSMVDEKEDSTTIFACDFGSPSVNDLDFTLKHEGFRKFLTDSASSELENLKTLATAMIQARKLNKLRYKHAYTETERRA